MSRRRLIVVSAAVMGIALLTIWLLFRWSFGVRILAAIGAFFTVWSIANLFPLDPKLATAAEEARKRKAVELILKPAWVLIATGAVMWAIVWASLSLWNFMH
jgi:hypothetical protein